MKISCIVATDLTSGIGFKNTIPWHLPEELKYFKEVTLGKPVIMGRKTFESLPFILPDRLNIVLTSQGPIEGVITVSTCNEALTAAEAYWDALNVSEESREAVVIGGAAVYKAFESLYDRVYLTVVEQSFTADTYFDNKFLFADSVPKDTWLKSSENKVDGAIPYTKYIYEKAQQKLNL